MSPTINKTRLRILVFGPNPTCHYPRGFEKDLAKKRQEIKQALQADGHDAVFPEDLLRGSIDPAINNHYVWEQMLVQEYDMVINLVGTYGAVDELSLCMKPPLALKAALFFNKKHCKSLAFQHAKVIEAMGAKLHLFTYPADLKTCKLMKRVRAKVWDVRILKFYAS